MKDIPKKRGLFGENSNVPLVSSTEQVVHFKNNVGTTLDEVINDIDISKVGEVYMSDGESLTPMTTTDEDGKKITILPKDQFGKVADVKLNGVSILNSENVANINISASVSNTTGTPTVTPAVNGGNVILNFSGIKGEQGIPGEGAIWTGEGEEIMTLEQETGSAINKVMSQKAVTEALINPAKFVLEGKGGNNNNLFSFKLASGHTYKLRLNKTTWNESATVATIFSIGKYVNGEWTSLYTVAKGSAALSEYIVQAESDASEYTAAIRADVGEEIEITIEDIGDVLFGADVHIAGDTYTTGYNNSSGFRYYIWVDKEFACPSIFKLKGDIPSGVQWALQGFTSSTNVKSMSATTTEDTSYAELAREHKFEKSTYMRVAFRADSGNLSTSQMAQIKQNAILEVVPLTGQDTEVSLLKNSSGKAISPVTKAESVYYGSTPLKDFLDANVFYKEFNMSDMVASNPINSRRRYTTKVPQTPFYAKAEGSIPNGFVCYIGTNYTISDAKNPNVSHVQSTGWGVLSGYFDVENAYYVTIGWKKSNNENFSEADIAALEASNIKLVVRNFSLGADESTDIISLNDESRTLTYLRNAKRPQYKGSSYTPTTTPCTLLHFSDIHADEQNMKRIVEFYNYYKSYIDDALCTGDIIKNLFSDSFAFWENAEAGSILNCAGNHEYYNGESTTPYYQQITQKQVYDKFFAPYIEDWGVTQPEDAEENGLNYYYKDYVTSKVRLIVLDNFRVDEAQLSWFEDVLSDAITSGLHVVAAIHIGNPIGMNTYDTTFNSLRENNPSSANGWVFGASESLYAKVDEFIGNGGVFVAWLMGHRHTDVLGTPHDHPSQLVIHVATASCGNSWDIIPKGDNGDRTIGTKSQDCFNIYSIDTYYKMIRIHRVGRDVDRDFRHVGNLCYDYENHRVIYSD